MTIETTVGEMSGMQSQLFLIKIMFINSYSNLHI